MRHEARLYLNTLPINVTKPELNEQFDCRVMLADKLLAKMDYDCDREIRTLELLKIRFGDSNMHHCEV